MPDYNLTPETTEHGAPENSITLRLNLTDGSEVRVTVAGYKDERDLVAALHNVGKREFLYNLVQSMLSETEGDDDDE
jgi:hypothetical protein